MVRGIPKERIGQQCARCGISTTGHAKKGNDEQENSSRQMVAHDFLSARVADLVNAI